MIKDPYTLIGRRVRVRLGPGKDRTGRVARVLPGGFGPLIVLEDDPTRGYSLKEIEEVLDD